MYPLILSLSDKMQSIYSEKANLNKHKERLTPDKSSQDGCIMLGVFYCSEKGHAIRRDSLQGFPNGRHRQSDRRAGTKCCPHERGHYGHCTGWKRTSGIRGQTSYFICTYRSLFQRGCGLFLFDTFLFYSQTYYKRIHDFHYGRTWDFSGALFLRLNASALQGARTAAPVLELFTKFQDWRESE